MDTQIDLKEILELSPEARRRLVVKWENDLELLTKKANASSVSPLLKKSFVAAAEEVDRLLKALRASLQ